MREIFPENNYTEIVGRDSDIVKKEDILPITEQLNQTKQALEILQSQFESYQTEISESVNTSVINSITAAIQTIDATLANIDNAEVDNLTVNTRATLTTLSAQIASITSALTAPEATINELSSLDIQAVNGAIQTLQSESATFDTITTTNYNIDNVNANTKITSPSAEITEIDSSSISTNSLSTGDIAATGDMNIEGNIASLGEITAPEISVENIVWKGSIALSDVSTFYMEIPHFENGQYYIQLVDNGNAPFATIEIFNSVDNFLVRWSQSDTGNIEKIYKVGTNENAQLYFKLSNSTGNALTIKYATTSATENVQGPETYTTKEFEPLIDYTVVYKDGNKFFKNIDVPGSEGSFPVLHKEKTNHVDADTVYTYDGTEPVSYKNYVPDQDLNINSDVEFGSVQTDNRLKTPNIYNGPTLSAADRAALPNDTLLVETSSTVWTHDSAALHDYPVLLFGDHNNQLSQLTDDDDDLLHGRAWSKYGIGYEMTGYTVGIRLGPTYSWYNISNNPNGEDFANAAYKTSDDPNKTGFRIFGRHLTLVKSTGHLVIDNDVCDIVYNEGSASVGTVIDLGDGRYAKKLAVNANYKVIDTVTFNVAVGEGAKITRKTTKNDETQVLPIIPYEEISTQQTPVDNTHPIVYDNSTDSLKKSTGDITIDGDLDVGIDLSVAGDTSITGDTSVGGDVTITGDISADNATFTGDLTADGLNISENLTVSGNTTIHGDLWVSGTTHTTKEESVSTTGDVVVLRQNNNTSLGATYAGMLINKYDGNSDLALVTDSDGTLRVGTGTGADTVYSNLYWDNDTEKWYSDSALTTEVSPTGTLTSWDTLEEIGDVLHYTNAVFTVINFTGLVPLLARDESTNMNADGFLQWDSTNLIAKAKSVSGLTNGALLKWNSTTKMFENIGTTPAANEFLSYTGTAYDWATPPKAYVFATMAEYNAAASSVPDGSVVYITSLPNYLRADI